MGFIFVKKKDMLIYKENGVVVDVPESVVTKDYYILGVEPEIDSLLNWRLMMRDQEELIKYEIDTCKAEKEVEGVDYLLRELWVERIKENNNKLIVIKDGNKKG